MLRTNLTDKEIFIVKTQNNEIYNSMGLTSQVILLTLKFKTVHIDGIFKSVLIPVQIVWILGGVLI